MSDWKTNSESFKGRENMPKRTTPMHNFETHGRPCETHAGPLRQLIFRHVYRLSFRLKKFEYYELRVMFPPIHVICLRYIFHLPAYLGECFCFLLFFSSITIRGHEGIWGGLVGMISGLSGMVRWLRCGG